MSKRKDPRPICDCEAYPFPHKIGGKCDGSAFVEYYRTHDQSMCYTCNCNVDGSCEVVSGAESINESECYFERVHYYPSEHLPLNFVEPEEFE